MMSQQSTDRYQEILEGQTELICRYMPDGRLSYVNEAYSRYYRMDRSELINKNFFPNVPSEDLPVILQRIASLRQGNTIVDLEHRVILPDGEVRWQCWTHCAVLDPSGEIVEYQAVGRDITPQKLRERQYEELLLSSRQRLKEVNCLYAITEVLSDTHRPLSEVVQAVVDLLPNAFQYPAITCARLVLLGRDCRTDNYADGVWRQTIDILVRGEWLGFLEISYLEERPILDSGPFLTAESLLLQEVVKRLHQVVDRTRAEEALRRSEEDFARFSGCLEHLLHERTAQIEKLGKAFRHEKSVRQATQRALQESETRLRDVFNEMHDGGWILEPRGTSLIFVDFNKAAERMEKISRAEVLGRSLETTLPWVGSHGLEEALHRVRERGLPEHCDVTFCRDGAAYAWREFYLYAIPSGEIVVCYEDVSARKMVEADLRQAHKTEAIGQLAGGIAHDFNNILAGVIGYAELLELGFTGQIPAAVEPPTGLHYTRELIKASFRARDLVQQILTFSRRSTAEKRLLNLPPLVKETVKLLRASIPATATITCRVDTTDAIVIAEPTQIHQIVMNLCCNAAAALPDGRGTIEVTLEAAGLPDPRSADPDSPSGLLLLRVRDDGQGMNSEVLERIFEPYFTTKPVGEGTGIGLSVVLGIVESLGGRIEVASAVGRGSEFRVYLPPAAPGTATVEEEASVPVVRGSGRLLIVDDDVTIVECGGMMLEAAGFMVSTATNGLEALEIYRTAPERIDLVITDEIMPGMTGSELTSHLRAIRPELPVILCSGYHTSATEDKMRTLGMNAFLRKPFTSQQLVAAITKALATGGGDAAAGWKGHRQQGEVDHGMSLF